MFENEKLTCREIEVLKLLKKGYSNKEMAKKMCISFHTIKTHLETIYYKLNSKNRIQAVISAYKLGYINLEND